LPAKINENIGKIECAKRVDEIDTLRAFNFSATFGDG